MTFNNTLDIIYWIGFILVYYICRWDARRWSKIYRWSDVRFSLILSIFSILSLSVIILVFLETKLHLYSITWKKLAKFRNKLKYPPKWL